MKRDVSPDTDSPGKSLPYGILISIGCDRYDSVAPLQSAELDAANIFSALTSGPAALYDPEYSLLLRSPSRLEIDMSLRSMLQHQKGVNAFAIYFAGHGAICDGTLYLCPADTAIDAMSVSTINISHILRAVCELRPRHAYVILDACFSGGAALDLGSILRSDILERLPSFGLSILTSAHMSRTAGETPTGGLFTRELLKALTGTLEINDNQPALGLGEIVRKLKLSQELKEQAPNFWDLNLSGADTFCRNPIVKSINSTQTTFGKLRYSYQHASISDGLAKELWQKYLDLPKIDLETLPSLFRRVVGEHSQDPSTIEQTSSAIAQSFASALEAAEDTFAPVLARAAMVQALLSHHHIPETQSALASQIKSVCDAAACALTKLDKKLKSERFHLIGGGGIADLYFLPLRLTKILGWIGFLMSASAVRKSRPHSLAALRRLTRNLLQRYGNSIVAVSDEQAPYLLLFLAQCKAFGWVEEAEEVIGRIYNDFNSHFGRVLIHEATASHIVDYLLLKGGNPIESNASYIQNPTELFSVILIGATLFDLDEAIDESLIQLDHTAFSFYVPDCYRDFWQERMQGGLVSVLQLGHASMLGHGVWSIRDMHRIWRHHIAPSVNAARSGCSDTELLAAALMSLVMPDRLAWFAVPSFAGRITVPRTNDVKAG